MLEMKKVNIATASVTSYYLRHKNSFKKSDEPQSSD